MENNSDEQIDTLLHKQRAFFATHQTRSLKFRKENLLKFRNAVIKFEKQITDALFTDLHKSYEEAYLTEISIVKGELENHLKNLKQWADPEKVSTPLHLLPSSCRIYHEPLGVALIIAPWNYPFQLLMNPLIGAISSGCCAILKPSPYTPNVAAVMETMIRETFSENHIGLVQGGRRVNEALLARRFDVIFFTGSPSLGKVVMKAASENLTPVILELGGKSPCIVDKLANLDVAARRIAWGKMINAGQTCIAPDYIFAHVSVKEELISKLAQSIETMYGTDLKASRFFPRIVNQQAFTRLTGYLQEGRIRYGGQSDEKERFISPTILDEVKPDAAVMQDEIFGPILPILTFNEIREVTDFINAREKPLAWYYFGPDHTGRELLGQTTSGGGCINDTLMHIATDRLPFGGVGNSGMGKYHGFDSFLAFSNRRSVVSTPTWIDLPVKYAPFRFFNYIKRIL
ncbi:MAG: aldehyde dehydrogenase [Alphaproteobacteria bacterium]|nr:aldehyde dehydrogenase [Alphaproteobacteria bacterium]